MRINRCPKCGREPKLMEWLESGQYEVECPNCLDYSGGFDTPDEAIVKWNEITEIKDGNK